MCWRPGAQGVRCTGEYGSYVGGADLHHLSRGPALPSLARGLLGGGSAFCGACRRCRGSRSVLAVVEVGVAGAPEGLLWRGRIGGRPATGTRNTLESQCTILRKPMYLYRYWGTAYIAVLDTSSVLNIHTGSASCFRSCFFLIVID